MDRAFQPQASIAKNNILDAKGRVLQQKKTHYAAKKTLNACV
jgi:hypothetical protein